MAEEKKVTKKLLLQSAVTSFRMLRLVWGVDKKLFILQVVSYAIPGIIPFINAYIYKLIIDYVILAISGKVVSPHYLFILFLCRFFTLFLQDTAFRVEAYIGRIFWIKVPIAMNDLVFSKIVSLDLQYFEDSKFKDLLEKVRDSQNRPQMLTDNLMLSIQSGLQVVIALVALATLNPFLIFVIILISIPSFLIELKRSKTTWGIWSWQSPLRKRFWYLQDLLQNASAVKEIKIFQLGKKFLKDMHDIQEKFFVENKKASRSLLIANIEANLLTTMVYLGIEVFIIFKALAKKVTVGDIGFFTGVINNFQNGLEGLFRNVSIAYESSLYVSNIFELLDSKPLLSMPEHPQQIAVSSPPLIIFNHVDFRYPGTKRYTLRDFSLTINPGEKIAFVGENGAGKSTIIKLLARFYDVDAGEILINGITIKELDVSQLYKVIGALFQDFNRYEYLVKENISFGDIERSSNVKQIEDAAAASGAKSVISSLDNEYDQMLGKTFEEGVDLSVGQWQKIALARGFYRNAPVLILDEPTAAIDAKAESEIFSKVEKLSRDKTVIIISHRFSTVRNADRIVVLDKGKILEEGNHKTLMKKNGLYAELFTMQAKGYQ